MKLTRHRELRRRRHLTPLCFHGVFRARILDRPKPGKKFGDPLCEWFEFKNASKTAGLNHVLETVFRGGAPIANWYTGLIDDTGFTGDPITDTAAVHGGWAELTTYTAGTRPAWTPGAASAGSVTIGSAITLTTNADSMIRGIFVSSVNTKGSNTGLLWATAVEPTARSILNGQQYQFFYTITLVP